ncbi:MAG: phage major capsid protein [Lachnospiraceae bacterium]|jgi:HK97 family phage major capsid protein|nr:phage major capsid protein [Lachnospiraceae bacterium]MCH4027918.1 phage major capsid protein [Lachnospiraceae bacterium]MCH4065761.1 phage major capsid protein [Lachnospiraceae bacterium]MCH4111798.1 phage major capsid protein [Lachnospiraceae bacterium]
MTVQELMNKRAKAWEAAKAFLDSHRNTDGLLSAEDGETYDRMEKEITDYTREIDRLNRQAAIDEQMGKPTASPLTGKPGAGVKDDPERKGRASHAYAKAMIAAMRTGFHQVSDVLEEGNDANGGYLVPEEWDSRLIDKLDEENIFRNIATTITTSGEHKINIAATKPAAAWIEEGQELTFGDATFDQVILDAHKLHVAIKVTEELLYDNAFNLENYIIDTFGKAIGNAEEDAFLNGDGKGKPTGIFAETGGGQTGVTISGTKIAADDVISLIYSLKRPYRKNALFILNDSTLAVLRKLKDANGAYIWQPSYTAGEPDRLLGYSVLTSAYAPALEAGKPAIAFGDFSYYNIGDRGTRSVQELRELFAGNGMIGYVAKERVDGKLVLPEAVQLLKAGASA